MAFFIIDRDDAAGMMGQTELETISLPVGQSLAGLVFYQYHKTGK